ncbi:MAG: RHS repeat-associated core domain-containing protein [bacterium]
MSLPGVPTLLSTKATYDAAARLVAQTSEAGMFTNTYCTWSGGLESVSNSSLTASYASDILDRVTNITYKTASGEPMRSFTYAYDFSGMITQKVDMAAGSCVTNVYAYDGLGRLLSESTTQSGNETVKQFTYDLAGNRLSEAVNGVTNIYTYGIGNRLSSVSDGTGYTHDNAGNVSRIVRNGTTLDLVWNLQGQLLAVTNNGVLAESYTYDPLGRRLSTTTGGATVFHAYNGVQCIADLDASANLLRSYTWGQGIDNLLAMTVYTTGITNTFYAVKDHLGSVQALVNVSGSVVESYTYDAYGNTTILSSDLSPLTSSQLGNRYLFQGREYSSATSLYNFRARWYDSQTGRWLSNDPIGISGGLNLYAFCNNDPVNFRDPMGLCKEKKLLDGEAEAQKYVSDLWRDRFKLLNLARHADSAGLYDWSTDENRDLKGNERETYAFRGYKLNGPQQGNVDAAYAFTRVFDPLTGVAVSLGVESLTFFQGASNWEEAKGSFAANWIGIKEGTKDNVREFLGRRRLLP